MIAYLRISDNVKQRYDVRTASQILQYFNLSLDLLLLDGLQHLDDALIVALNVDSLKHLRVLSSPDFPQDFILVLGAEHTASASHQLLSPSQTSLSKVVHVSDMLNKPDLSLQQLTPRTP